MALGDLDSDQPASDDAENSSDGSIASSQESADAGDGAASAGGDSGEGSVQAEPKSDDEILRKRTLQLGEVPSPSTAEDESSSSEQEELPDSQVSNGWLGKAINHVTRVAKAEQEQKALQERVASCTRVAKETPTRW